MNTIRLSATSARNRFLGLLNKVALGTDVIIEKNNIEVAILSPKTTQTDWKGILKASAKVHGILKDVPVKEIAPAGQKEAWKMLS